MADHKNYILTSSDMCKVDEIWSQISCWFLSAFPL